MINTPVGISILATRTSVWAGAAACTVGVFVCVSVVSHPRARKAVKPATPNATHIKTTLRILKFMTLTPKAAGHWINSRATT